MTYLLVSRRKSMPGGWIKAKYRRPADRNTEGPSELYSMPACFLACKNPIQKTEDKKHSAFILLVLSKVLLDDTTQIPYCKRIHFSSLGLELSVEMQNSPPKRSRHDSLIAVFMSEA